MRRVHPIRGAPKKIEFLEKTTYVSGKNREVVFFFCFFRRKIRLFCVAVAIFKSTYK